MAQNQPITGQESTRFNIVSSFATKANVIQGKRQAFHDLVGWDETFIDTPSGRVVGCVLVADHRIRLGTFLPLNDVELHIIALFQCLVSVQLNRRIVNEYIRAVIASDESIALSLIHI